MSVRSIERSPPKGISRLFWRFPIWFFRLKLNWLLGERFLLLRHTGRISGEQRESALEVVEHIAEEDTFYVVSAWGEKADWFKNISQHPAIEVTVGRRHFSGESRVLTSPEAEAVYLRYSRENPKLARYLPKVAGFHVDGTEEDYKELAGLLKFVALTPTD